MKLENQLLALKDEYLRKKQDEDEIAQVLTAEHQDFDMYQRSKLSEIEKQEDVVNQIKREVQKAEDKLQARLDAHKAQIDAMYGELGASKRLLEHRKQVFELKQKELQKAKSSAGRFEPPNSPPNRRRTTI